MSRPCAVPCGYPLGRCGSNLSGTQFGDALQIGGVQQDRDCLVIGIVMYIGAHDVPPYYIRYLIHAILYTTYHLRRPYPFYGLPENPAYHDRPPVNPSDSPWRWRHPSRAVLALADILLSLARRRSIVAGLSWFCGTFYHPSGRRRRRRGALEALHLQQVGIAVLPLLERKRVREVDGEECFR